MNRIFGNKESFAIEIGNLVPEKKSAKLRFWVNNIPIGTFRVNFTLKYAIKSFEELIENSSLLYDTEFDSRSPAEIFTLCTLIDKDIIFGDWKDEYEEQFNRYKKFSPFFGDQLDDACLIIYVKDSMIYFIWSTNSDYSKKLADIDYLKNLKSTMTSYEAFENTSKEFLSWYKNSILLN